jgi:hypothetical protein
VGDARGSKLARYLKKSGEGITPDDSVTNFRVVCHHGSCHSGSWEELVRHVADTRIMTREVMTVMIPKSNDKTGHRRTTPATAGEQDPKRRKFPGGGTPARGCQPGRPLEPACPEMAGGTVRNPASTTRTTKPDRKPWDFDESGRDFGEKRNPPKPHASP